MERILLVFAIFLVCSSQLQGSSAVTPVTLFVQEGQDVLLNVTIPDGQEEDAVFWSFNQSSALVDFYPGGTSRVSPLYKERVEVSANSYSVKLKNLQKADSGVYSVKVRGAKEETLAEYNIIVRDPVSPVNLSVDSLSNHSDSCNFTVTCTTRDSHISSTFRCHNQVCSQDGGNQSKITSSGASLQILVNHLVTCHHSNQISSAKDSKLLEYFCPPRNVFLQGNKGSEAIGIGLGVCGVLAISIIIGLIVRHRKKGKYNRKDIEETEYDTPRIDPAVQPLQQHQTHDSSGISPTSTYCVVGPHSGSSGTRGKPVPESLYDQAHTPGQNTDDTSCTSPTSTYSLVGPHSGLSGTRGKSLPESLYAQVERPARS